MNKLRLEINTISGKYWLEYESVIYTNCTFIRLIVDGINLVTKTENRKGVIVWDETKKTLRESGEFLLMTCICGAADHAGFKLVEVRRKENSVSWTFKDESGWDWEFPLEEYDNELRRVDQELDKLDVSFPLQPKTVIFPEIN